jgi:hypothetical protein
MLLLLLFLGSLAAGYLYFVRVYSKERSAKEAVLGTSSQQEDMFSLKMFYPLGNYLHAEDRKIPMKSLQRAGAETIVEEYLRGPISVSLTNIPRNARLIGIYKDVEKVLYIDLSEEFRRNFQGDAVAEFLLLKGLYESLISNLQDIYDIKILIEGREVETIGGHIYLLYPLKDTVSIDISISEFKRKAVST